VATVDKRTALSFLCPRCHRPFTKQIVKREVVDDKVSEAPKFEGSRSRPYSVDVTKAVVKYAHYCRCRHCGHEWTETKVVEFNA